MTKNQLRCLIRRYLDSLDDDTPVACERADEAAGIIREIGKLAIDVGLPAVARICKHVTTPFLDPAEARIALAECLSIMQTDRQAAKETPKETAETFTLTQAAPLLGLTIHGVRKLVARSRRAAQGKPVKGKTIRFCQDGKGGTIRFKPEWILEYLDRTTVDPGDNGSGNGNEKPRTDRNDRKGRGQSGLDWGDLD